MKSTDALLGEYCVQPPPPKLPDSIKYVQKHSLTKIDFFPSGMKSTWEELYGLLNDWKNYNQEEVILNVENLEMLWPEIPMYSFYHPGPRGQTTFKVRCLRVWIKTTGLPRFEQRFSGGDLASPEVFSARTTPKPNADNDAGAFASAPEVYIDRLHSWTILIVLVMSIYVMMVKFE